MDSNTQPAKPTEGHGPTPPASVPPASTISIDQFINLVQLQTAKVVKVEIIPNKDRLYQLTLEVGSETRTVVSGIRGFFPNPEELLGKTVVLLANLEAKKLGGVMSQGMVLAAEDNEGNFALLVPEKSVASGAKIR